MARSLKFALALAGVLMVATLATARTTTITTLEIEEEEPANAYSRLSCREQVQRQDMRQCQQYLSRRTYRRNGEAKGLEEDNPYPYTQQEVQRCCRQLRGLDRACQCEAIRYMVQRQREQGHLGHQDLQQTVQRARMLQSLCGVPQRCDVRPSFFLEEVA